MSLEATVEPWNDHIRTHTEETNKEDDMKAKRLDYNLIRDPNQNPPAMPHAQIHTLRYYVKE